jgi:Tfp pilus assembly protein PilF
MAGAILLDRDLDAATAELLRAYELRPTRAESLYYLARAHKAAGRDATADLFAREVLRIPVPQHDELFVDLTCYPGERAKAEEVEIDAETPPAGLAAAGLGGP